MSDELLRTSERLMFNRCRWQHDMAYTRRLQPKRAAPALRFGTLIHRALELHYQPRPVQSKRKRPSLPALFEIEYHRELAQTQEDWPNWRDDNDEWHTFLALGVAMLTGYAERWAEQDKEYITLATEQTFQYPIIQPEQSLKAGELMPATSPTTYVGTLDRVLYHRPTRRLLFGDYKTTGTDPTKVSHLALDDQAGAYWAIAPAWLAHGAPDALRRRIDRRVQALPASARRAVLDRETGMLRFDGILYDFLYKRLPDERPKNKDHQSLNQDGSISKMQPLPLFHRETVYRDAADRKQVIQRIYDDAAEIGAVRAGSMRLKKSPDMYHCRFCAYRDICELHETGSDWQAMADVTMHTWNPYDAHEITDAAHEGH
jgi:PD-(D/E)XK nuclease superfamily